MSDRTKAMPVRLIYGYMLVTGRRPVLSRRMAGGRRGQDRARSGGREDLSESEARPAGGDDRRKARRAEDLAGGRLGRRKTRPARRHASRRGHSVRQGSALASSRAERRGCPSSAGPPVSPRSTIRTDRPRPRALAKEGPPALRPRGAPIRISTGVDRPGTGGSPMETSPTPSPRVQADRHQRTQPTAFVALPAPAHPGGQAGGPAPPPPQHAKAHAETR